jgi:hypothetical protein
MKDYQQRVKKIQKTSLELILASREAQLALSQFKMPHVSFEKRIAKASENLNLIYLTNTQRTIVNEIAKEIAGMISFGDFIIRGFLWRAIRLWQKNHNQPIALVSQMNRTEQFRAGIEILNYTKQFLSRAMYIPDKNLKKRFLEDIMRKISEYYEELLSVQTFLNDPENEEILLDHEIQNWLEENESLFSS